MGGLKGLSHPSGWGHILTGEPGPVPQPYIYVLLGLLKKNGDFNWRQYLQSWKLLLPFS